MAAVNPVSLAAAGALILVPALIRPKRRIADFAAMVTISEDHVDETTITQHPIDKDAAITDHAYTNPSTVTIRCGWSSSPNPEAFAEGTAFWSMEDVYNGLLSLMRTRTPFDVVTGKRSYGDMLIRSISSRTTQETENSLVVTVVCQQIIRVSTAETTVSSDASTQEVPEETMPTVPNGVRQAVDAPSAPDFNAPPYVFDPANP